MRDLTETTASPNQQVADFFHLAHSLLEVEGYLVESSWIENIDSIWYWLSDFGIHKITSCLISIKGAYECTSYTRKDTQNEEEEFIVERHCVYIVGMKIPNWVRRKDAIIQFVCAWY